MAYTDRDLLIATQIAYYNLNNTDEGLSLREILKKNQSIYVKLCNDFARAKTDLERTRAENALALYKEIISPGSKYGDWIIRDVRDDNRESGFVACLIETDEHSAIIGFRGSESNDVNGVRDPNQIQKDWIDADFGLLNGETTRQQEVATDYMRYINENYNYDNYATSGHSLGGNLSVHAGITAPRDMQDKISQCYSYDGPGFSDEYIAKHKDEIEIFSKKIVHYQWSVVGALLTPIPGESFRTIKTKDEVYNKNDMSSLTQKHDTGFVLFDSDGNVVDGEKDPLASTVGKLSKDIDDHDAGNGLVKVISSFMTMSDEEKKKIGISALLAGVTILPSEATAVIVTTAICIVAAGTIDPNFYAEVLIPFVAGIAEVSMKLSDFVKSAIKTLEKTFINAKENWNNFKDMIHNQVDIVINNLSKWFFEHSSGYSYASSNPYIVIDTGSMQRYAGQLARISQRAKILDRNMNSLYWQLGIDWSSVANLAKLLKAEIILDFAYRLDACTNFLMQTARDFDAVENDICNNC